MAALPPGDASSSPQPPNRAAFPRSGSRKIRWSAASWRRWPHAPLATKTIELGIGVWNPYLRHPAQIAMEIGALDELSGGRAALGIGSGLAAPIRKLGIDNSRPLGALRDTFAIVRGLLSGESFTHKGSVFSVEDVKLSYKPLRADVPLLMAARGEQALALCGRIADGLMISNMCPPGFAASCRAGGRRLARGAVRALRRAGRTARRPSPRSSRCWPAC